MKTELRLTQQSFPSVDFFAKADTDTDTKGVLGNTIAFVSQIFSITLLWYTTSHDKHLLHNVSV